MHAANWGRPAESMVGMHMADLVGVGLRSSKKISHSWIDCFAGENVRFDDWFDNARGHRYLCCELFASAVRLRTKLRRRLSSHVTDGARSWSRKRCARRKRISLTSAG